MKLGAMKKPNTKHYYIVVEEWLYPTESGRNVIDDYDTLEEALEKCRTLAESEEENFEANCKVDCLPAERCLDDNFKPEGYEVTSKNGLEDWFYVARVIKVPFYGTDHLAQKGPSK